MKLETGSFALVVAVAFATLLASTPAFAVGGKVNGHVNYSTSGGLFTFSVNAQDLGEGDASAKGTWVYHDRGVEKVVHADVTCLMVDGNSALITGIDRATGEDRVVGVVDNGEGSAAEADRFTRNYPLAEPLASMDCPSRMAFVQSQGGVGIVIQYVLNGTLESEGGNIQVK